MSLFVVGAVVDGVGGVGGVGVGAVTVADRFCKVFGVNAFDHCCCCCRCYD